MLTAERLRELLDYDPQTGVFIWLRSHSNQIKAGAVAGSPNERGYLRITIDGCSYRAHRLAWLYVYGEWPPGRLDHQDTISDHNWISNLRPATQSQNMGNTCRGKNNTSGFKGVSWCKIKRLWRARIKVDYHERSLGYFTNAEDAHTAYCIAAAEAFGEFARAK